MQLIESINDMQSTSMSLRTQGKLIGFVPTMGYLHEGHLSLIDKAKEQADVVVVSLFVNPTQFGPSEDLSKYPKDMESDRKRCEERGADYLFAPQASEIYPPDYSTWVTEDRYSSGLCGISRPHHFRGVATVVAMLFNIVRPDLAVFGQKDAQQCAIIRKMVRDLHFPVEIVTAPTMREPDGLAMSSRNTYLKTFQRKDAAQIYAALSIGKNMVEGGIRNVDRVAASITHHLIQFRRLRLIYVSVVDKDTMEPLREIKPGQTLIALACWCDEVRLIDNIVV